jgi:adenylate kinase
MSNEIPLVVVNDRAAWLTGPAAKCAVRPAVPLCPWRIVLLGAPGVGKGTQAEHLAHRLGACHLSTGDIFRNAKSMCDCERTAAMNSAIDFMKRGDLVPDEIVLSLVRERSGCLRCRGGFILDGFPRTVAQAMALEKLLQSRRVELDAVIDYSLPVEKIIARLSGRQTCTKCKAVFHTFTRPSRFEGLCDHCGGELVQREDDQPAAVRVRLDAYIKSTAPLTEYYRTRGLLMTIDAHGSPEEILSRTLAPFSVGLARLTL